MAIQNFCIWPIKSYLGNYYYVPDYQREYSWEEKELDDFVKDLMNVMCQEEEAEHFFGQIVIHNDTNEKKKYIVDGQQRTTTSVIFLRALQIAYDKLYKESNIKQANYRQSDISSIMIGREDDVHLVLGRSDKDYFYNQIQIGQPARKIKERIASHQKIKNAFYFFVDFIEEQINDMKTPEEKMEWLDNVYFSFIEKFNVIYLEVTTLAQAYTVFETLNGRGTNLAPSDLIKNFIFRETSYDVEEVKYKWNDMIDTLDGMDCTKYIRCFYNSRYDFIREKELFNGVSNLNCDKFIDDIYENAKIYFATSRPEEDEVVFENKDLRDGLSALKTLRITTFYPVVLAMKCNKFQFSDHDICKVVKKIETYVFRNFTICKLHSNFSEKFFAFIAKDIYNENLNSVDEICKRIEDATVSDDKFIESFESWSSTKNITYVTRYILKKIHNHLDKNMEINTDNSVVHIEHIMPKNIDKWDIDKETHRKYLYRLGNMILLSGKINTSVQNKTFDVKKERYKESKIEPNKDICEYDVWDEHAIEDRQKKLAQYALQIWKK